MVTSKLWEFDGRRLGETTMKMLIAQEMENVMKAKETAPSVVAKLMGVNTFPAQQKAQTCKRNLQGTPSHNCPNSALQDYRQQEEGFYNQMQYRSELCFPEKYKDVYDVKQQISTKVQTENQNLQNGDCHDNLMENRMALVQQKFIEAKRLATNERLLQSKEFKDALEVLNSNKDLFLKFLEEPNSMFSRQLKELQKTISLLPQAKRITVLKPTSLFATYHEKAAKKTRYTCGEDMREIDIPDRSSSLFRPKDDVVSQLTRIIVLKPSPSMPREKQSYLASHNSLSVPESMYESGNSRMDEEIRVREVAKKINQPFQKDLTSARKDAYPTSGFSHEYAADHSSVNRFVNDFREERGNDYSNSKLVTPTSQNSWVHMRSGSPGSLSSFDHESNSSVSSVNKEAKRRLSERLLLVISNDNRHEQPDFRKVSSTLGEMLSVPLVKKEEEVVDRLATSPSHSYGLKQDMSVTGICSSSGRLQESSEFYPENFTSLKSIQTSTCYENMKVNEETTCSLSSNATHDLNALPKIKDGKSTFKEKVSGLFFSRMKRLLRNKSNLSTKFNSDDRLHAASTSPVNDINPSKSFHDGTSDESAPTTLANKFVKFTSPLILTSGGDRIANISIKGIRSIEKLWKSDSRENSKQPSPISLLERPFKEDFVSSNSKQQALSRSVGRCSYWENAHIESVSPNSLKLFRLFSKEDKEQEQLDFIQKLLESSNLANEKSTAILAKSHSLDSPLDPALLDELLEIDVAESKCRERRSNQRLLFDCVNLALTDIGHCALLNVYPWPTTSVRARKHVKTNSTVADAVWCLVKDCFSEEEICISSKAENNRRAVDYFVKNEVSGNGLVESIWLEMDELSKEIGEKVLEELFLDALSDLTGWSLC